MVFTGNPFDMDDSMYSWGLGGWGNPFLSSGQARRAEPRCRHVASSYDSHSSYDPFSMSDNFFDSPRPRYRQSMNRFQQRQSPPARCENPRHQYVAQNPFHHSDTEMDPAELPIQRETASKLQRKATRPESSSPRNHMFNDNAYKKCIGQWDGYRCQSSSEDDSSSDEDAKIQTEATAKPTPAQNQGTVRNSNCSKTLSKSPPKLNPTDVNSNPGNKERNLTDSTTLCGNEPTSHETRDRENVAKDECNDGDKPNSKESPTRPIKLTNDEKLKAVGNDLVSLEARIAAFNGGMKDREYIYIDEMLTKALLTLDAVESEGNCEIRNSRKQLVNRVQSLVDQLENKVRIEGEVESVTDKSDEVTMGYSRDDCVETVADTAEHSKSDCNEL